MSTASCQYTQLAFRAELDQHTGTPNVSNRTEPILSIHKARCFFLSKILETYNPYKRNDEYDVVIVLRTIPISAKHGMPI
jgi:hypothetical protein